MFFPWICEVVNSPNKPPHTRSAITFGVALGNITDDADNRGGSYRAKRAEGYKILATFIHEITNTMRTISVDATTAPFWSGSRVGPAMPPRC